MKTTAGRITILSCLVLTLFQIDFVFGSEKPPHGIKILAGMVLGPTNRAETIGEKLYKMVAETEIVLEGGEIFRVFLGENTKRNERELFLIALDQSNSEATLSQRQEVGEKLASTETTIFEVQLRGDEANAAVGQVMTLKQMEYPIYLKLEGFLEEHKLGDSVPVLMTEFNKVKFKKGDCGAVMDLL